MFISHASIASKYFIVYKTLCFSCTEFLASILCVFVCGGLRNLCIHNVHNINLTIKFSLREMCVCVVIMCASAWRAKAKKISAELAYAAKSLRARLSANITFSNLHMYWNKTSLLYSILRSTLHNTSNFVAG